ncbi:jacalin-related lectin 3-like [Cynara cardunculus var. scolymus]|uniref:jacalin-related lectin 3-like n=1 Tax=Cynara cardunculus var. scolymus TaxID=59895 RepID=UPI000D62F55E|nr:jacalin-related lectin 3-like [Cynara cardunculus var. scolymus]
MGVTTDFEGCISLGPWGGPKGKIWNFMPQGFIKKISIKHGGVIDSIKFQSESASFFGGKGGNQTDRICIDYPDEYLVSINGTVYGGFDVVMSLCFVTNKNRYGPYGSDTGTRFSYNGKGGIIVGFHGRVGKYLDAVGIYVMPKSFVLGRNSAFEDKSTHEVHPMVSKSTILVFLFCF